MQFRSIAISVVAVASMAAAQLTVTTPSAANWWVAKSTNVLQWSCKADNVPQTFTVLIGNQNPAVLVQPLAIIAIQNNYDCSVLITQDQANQAAGTGYEVLLANPINNTDVYARSEAFEIKPLGSLYPTQQAEQVASASAAAASASTTAASSSTKKGNSAAGLGASLVLAAAGVVGGVLAVL
ncbi:hypothetical protein D9611_006599 [Ephemerocybe angulata]|uniref:Uncharacterized protein n=1 Tax=Ephemerocybe angulata TaxID=980116 RepID=A0A8H5FGI4_9AGAR|nr:hypothetical protein D9611_006599 [Tulosesus angulatus]